MEVFLEILQVISQFAYGGSIWSTPLGQQMMVSHLTSPAEDKPT